MNVSKDRYRIQDWHVIDAESNPSREIYIREILDWRCSEFDSSKFSAQQRLEIIDALGLGRLAVVLSDCYRKNNKPWPDCDAGKDAHDTVLFLRKAAAG